MAPRRRSGAGALEQTSAFGAGKGQLGLHVPQLRLQHFQDIFHLLHRGTSENRQLVIKVTRGYAARIPVTNTVSEYRTLTGAQCAFSGLFTLSFTELRRSLSPAVFPLGLLALPLLCR